MNICYVVCVIQDCKIKRPQNGATLTTDGLPRGWQEVKTANGETYYYHVISRVSRWDKPTPEVAAALEQRLRESEKQASDAANVSCYFYRCVCLYDFRFPLYYIVNLHNKNNLKNQINYRE